MKFRAGKKVKEFFLSFSIKSYGYLKPRAFSAILLGALLCTIIVKLHHAFRVGLENEFFFWILPDVLFFLSIQTFFMLIMHQYKRVWVFRTVTIISAVVCTWSVMNAGWIVRTGSQILPTVLLPLFRDPLNALGIVGGNLIEMPITGFILLGPSFAALMFLFMVLLRPEVPSIDIKKVSVKTMVLGVMILLASLSFAAARKERHSVVISEGLKYNAHVKAVFQMLSFHPHKDILPDDMVVTRELPFYDEVDMKDIGQERNFNVVIIILEGVQFQKTSLADSIYSSTPFLSELASEGVNFVNMRSSLTHTTKAIFSLLTGRYPSASQDLAETIPMEKPYASLATILEEKRDYRTAFFQSAKGNFEARPGLINNLGFDKFWSRENLNDPNLHVGYLGSDEYGMIEPLFDWIDRDDGPFLATLLCSVTHDPYELPGWYSDLEGDPLFKYLYTIKYTDGFIKTVYQRLQDSGLGNTIFCVVGDHGEAFGEHGMHGHERIAFDEALKIPWVLKIPGDPQNKRIEKEVSSIDVSPTILSVLGLKFTEKNQLLGTDALDEDMPSRKVYYSGWMKQSPFGFVEHNKKYVYSPSNRLAWLHNLKEDSEEVSRQVFDEEEMVNLAEELIEWRKKTIIKIEQESEGRKTVFGNWNLKWSERVCSAKYNND